MCIKKRMSTKIVQPDIHNQKLSFAYYNGSSLGDMKLPKVKCKNMDCMLHEKHSTTAPLEPFFNPCRSGRKKMTELKELK